MRGLGIRGKLLVQGQSLRATFTPRRWRLFQKSGIKHEGRSKRAASREFRGVDFDLVVTVCDSAAEECPIWLGKGKKVHHSFLDPAVTNDMDDFRKVRDEIESVMIELLKLHS